MATHDGSTRVTRSMRAATWRPSLSGLCALPREIIEGMLSFLDEPALLSLAQTNRQLRDIVRRADQMWLQRYVEQWAGRRLRDILDTRGCDMEPDGILAHHGLNSWYGACRRRSAQDGAMLRNWRTGRHRSRLLTGHTDEVRNAPPSAIALYLSRPRADLLAIDPRYRFARALFTSCRRVGARQPTRGRPDAGLLPVAKGPAAAERLAGLDDSAVGRALRCAARLLDAPHELGQLPVCRRAARQFDLLRRCAHTPARRDGCARAHGAWLPSARRGRRAWRPLRGPRPPPPARAARRGTTADSRARRVRARASRRAAADRPTPSAPPCPPPCLRARACRARRHDPLLGPGAPAAKSDNRL